MPKPPTSPPLSIVSSSEPAISPPRPLGNHGSALWNSVMREYRIEDAGGVEMLAQACAALDRAESLADAIAQDGPVIRTRAGPKSHPAVKDELGCRSFVVKTIAKLGLNVEAIKSPGRPPNAYGWTGDR